MTDETSTRRQCANEDPAGLADGLTGAVAYPSDPRTPHGDLSGPPEGVYEEAARALVSRFRVGSRGAADVEGYTAAPWLRAAVDVAYASGITEGLRRADNAITWGVTCLGCADKLDGLIAERAAGYAEGRRDALTEELAQSEGCAVALDKLPGQQQAAAFYRLHAEHVRAVLAQEPDGGAPLKPAAGDESTCHRCGGPNTPWSAPSPLWNAIMRGGSIGNRDDFDGIVCPTCFAVLAGQRGIADLWRLRAERVHVELETVTPSGRTWDAATWLWRDAEQDGGPR